MKRSPESESKIIQAALELFVRKGYHGTSVQDITHRVGLTKAAMYAHFSSKGALLLRIVDEFNSKFIGGMVAAVDRVEGDALDKIHCLISFNSKFAEENQDLVVFLTFLTTELKADVDFEPALKGTYAKYLQIVTEIVRQGMRQGLFKREFDPDLAALTFMALHDGVLHHWALNKHRIDATLYVRTFRKIFLHGFLENGVTGSWRPSGQNVTQKEEGV